MKTKHETASAASTLFCVHPFLCRPPSFWQSVLLSILCPNIIFLRRSSDIDYMNPQPPPGDAAEK